MGIIIKKPIGASKVYDKLKIENEKLSNLKDQQQEGIKEGGSTNKYFTGLTGSLPGELGQVFNPEESDIQGASGYGNSSTYGVNNNSIQKPLGVSDFYSSGSGGYSNINGNALPSSYEKLDDLTSNLVSPNGTPQYGLNTNQLYNLPPDSIVQQPLGASDAYKIRWFSEEPNFTPSDEIEKSSVDSSNPSISSNLGNQRPSNWQYQHIGKTNEDISYSTYDQNQIVEAGDIQRVGPNISAQNSIIDFRKKLRSSKYWKGVSDPSLFPDPKIEYNSDKKLELRVNLGDPGNPFNKNLTKYSSTSASPNSFDIINASAIYQSEGAKYSGENNDLVKFVIGAMDGTNPNVQVFMHFRAFLGSISDNYTGNWDSINYVGRGENFYNYTGFDRKVSLSFTVAAQSKAELAPMYRKLNFLASNLAPDYSEYGYMRGPLVTLTIGGYFYNQPGFITGLTYEMSEETPWEIGINDGGGFDDSVKELTHVIKVSSFAFTPIHTFPVKKQTNNYGGTGGKATGYGRERYIALDAGHNNLYGDVYSSPVKDPNNNVPDPAPIKTTPQVGTVPQSTQLLATSSPLTTATPATTTPVGTTGGTGLTGNTGAGQFNWLQK